KWFPTGLRRVALPEPPELAEFRMSRRYVRQMKKLKQAASRSKWPLLRRRWISNLRRHAQRLQGQLASLFPELPMPKPTRVRPMKLTVVVNSNEDIPTLEFIPGGFRYAGQVIPLRGKPREVFEKLARSPLKRLTLEIAAKEIWTDGRGVTPENFQKAISQIRAVLMPLIHADQDPIPCIDRGKALAYKLELPYVLAKP
ncbi:MAG: hypothetical protein KDA75_06210, partial [Planctomycetaceae bacterium]|nr:hypothetical protein [Planctomycetaceae bacterium]